jgi:hypothetical protein
MAEMGFGLALLLLRRHEGLQFLFAQCCGSAATSSLLATDFGQPDIVEGIVVE